MRTSTVDRSPVRRRTFLAAMLMAAVATTAFADYTPVVTPPSLSVVQGAAGTFQAGIIPGPGFNDPVQIFWFAPSGLPAGMTVTPPTFLSNPPGYAPATFTVNTTGATPVGSYPITFRYLSVLNKDVNAQIVVTGAGDYQLNPAPATLSVLPGATGTTAIGVTGAGGFAQGVTILAPIGIPDVTVSPPTAIRNPGESQVFQIAVASNAAPRTLTLPFRGQSAGYPDRTSNVTLTIPAPPDFSLGSSPPSVALSSGGAPQSSTITLTPVNAFADTVVVSATVSPANGGVTVAPSAFNLTSASPAQVVTMTAPAGAPPGTYTITFTGVSGSLSRTATVQATVVSPPDFSLSASPPAVEVSAGDPAGASITVASTGLNGLTNGIQVTAPSLDGVTFTPSSFTLPPSGSATVTAAAAPAAAPGPRQVVFTGMASGVTGTRSTAPVTLTIHPAPPADVPEIDRITPPGAVQGTRSATFRLTGRNFKSGAAVIPASPKVQVERATVLSPEAVDVVLTVGEDVPIGPSRIDVRNPDGGMSPRGASLLVFPPGAIGAPLGVTTAAIVYPIDGSTVATNEALYPRGILATTGTGTVVGAWRLDGVEFDRFTAGVSAGLPVEIRSHVKIPAIQWGEHRLELVIEQPSKATAAAVTIVAVVERATRLLLLEPADHASVRALEVRFRWSLQPGVEGYRIEIERRIGDSDEAWEPRLTETTGRADWRPGRKQRAALGTGTFRWRVRPIYPVRVEGDPTAWSTFLLAARADGRSGHEEPRLIASAGSVNWSLRLADEQAPATPAVPLAVTPAATWADALLSPMLTLDWVEQSDSGARFQLSSQADVTTASGNTKLTADVSWRGVTDPEKHLTQESRSWVAGARASDEWAIRPEVTVGFTVPDFTSGSEFVTPGFAQTGGTVRLATRLGSIGYYQPAMIATHGISSALPRPDLRLFAVETPQGRDWWLKLIRFDSKTEESAYSPATEVEAWGLLGRVQLTPSVGFGFELADGEARATVDGESRTRAGTAARIALNGSKAGVWFGLNARYTDPEYVNPASANLTAGAIADRRTADLNIGRSFGRASVSAMLLRTETGKSAGSTSPEASSTSANLTISSMFGRSSVSLSGNTTLDRGEAAPALFFPETDRRQRGVNLSLAQPLGRFSLAQNVGVQRMRDEINPFSDLDVTNASLSMSGTLVSNFNLATSIGGTRSKGSVDTGTIDSFTVSLQPSLAWPARYVSLAPSVSWQTSRNERSGWENENELYQAALQWSPPWGDSLLSFQVSAGWTRGRASFAGTESRSRSRVVQATLALRRVRRLGSAAATASTLPGATSIEPPPPAVTEGSLETITGEHE